MHPSNAVLASLLLMSTAAYSQAPNALPAAPVPPEPPARIAQSADATRTEGDSRRAERELVRVQAQAQADGARREARRVPTDEEALALAAMEGLMTQPPQRSLPLIKKVLAGSQSTLVKQRAIFVLSQIDEPEAHALLLETARASDLSLRREAIRSIGISGNVKSLAGLQGIYAGGDAATKKYVMEAWMIAGRKAEVYQAALSAKSEVDANNAIHTLSVMGAVDELRKLGESQKLGTSLLEAYAISGDLASLRKIADAPGEMSVRGEAVRRIGIIGSEAARTVLREIYLANVSPQLRDAALHGMLISGDQQTVLALYRAAKTAEEKRTLLRTLSIMGGDAALQAIDAALEGKK